MAILESQVGADPIKWLIEQTQARKRHSIEVQLVPSVVVESADANRCVIARAGRTGRLDSIPALRVTFQIESLRDAGVDIFCAARRGRIVVSVDDCDGPSEVPVVRITAEFNSALRRSQRKRIIRSTQSACHASLVVNVVTRRVNASRLREGQVQFKLAEPDIQRIFRQFENVPEVAVLQVAIAEPAIGSGAARGDVVINPERQVRAEASSANNRKGIRNKQVRSWHEACALNHASGLFRVPVEIAGVPESDGQVARNFAGIDCAGKGFFLRLRTQKHRWFLDETLVILRELEAVLLESFSKIV